MKHFFSLLCCVLFATAISAQTFTFSSADPQTIDGVTVSFDKGTNSTAPTYYSNGLRLYANNTVTVSGSNLTSIQITFAKQGSKAYASLSANCGTLVSGGESTATDSPVVDTWTGSAASVTFTLGASGQRLIQQIIVNNAGGTPSDTTIVTPPTDTTTVTPSVDLDPNYVYSEPTAVVTTGDETAHAAFSFVQNNIHVSCTQGAITGSYFSAYAGASITFTASKPIKGLAADAFLKQNFSATASVGQIDYLDASEDTIVGSPAIIVSDINTTSITLTCVKQVRFYEVRFYFDANPDEELTDNNEGGYSYDWEPDEVTTMNFAPSSFSCMNLDYLGYACSYLTFEGDDADIYLVAFSHTISGTGLAVGTYPISDSYAEGTLQASIGGDDDFDYECYVATNYEEYDGTLYYDPYYLVSGSLKVEAAAAGVKMTLNATSAKGSTINMVYEGPVEIIADDTALEDNEATSSSTKLFRDGHIFIIRGGHTFTPTGQMVK